MREEPQNKQMLLGLVTLIMVFSLVFFFIGMYVGDQEAGHWVELPKNQTLIGDHYYSGTDGEIIVCNCTADTVAYATMHRGIAPNTILNGTIWCDTYRNLRNITE